MWVIFSHVKNSKSPLDEEDLFIHLLNRIGTQIDSFGSKGASAYLYDLSEEKLEKDESKFFSKLIQLEK